MKTIISLPALILSMCIICNPVFSDQTFSLIDTQFPEWTQPGDELLSRTHWDNDPPFVKAHLESQVNLIVNGVHSVLQYCYIAADPYGDPYPFSYSFPSYSWSAYWAYNDTGFPWSRLEGKMKGSTRTECVALYDSWDMTKGYSNAENRVALGVRVKGQRSDNGTQSMSFDSEKSYDGVQVDHTGGPGYTETGGSVSAVLSWPPSVGGTINYSRKDGDTDYAEVKTRAISEQIANHSARTDEWECTWLFTGMVVDISVEGTDMINTSKAILTARGEFTFNNEPVVISP